MNPLDLRWQMVRDRWPLRVKNSSAAVIPPFSVLRITNWSKSNNEIVYTVAQPDSTYRWRYLVSGPFAIGAGSSDEGCATFLANGGPVYFNSGTPAEGEEWGPTASQWYLTQHRPGFIVAGAQTDSFNSKSLLVATQAIPAEVLVKNDSGSPIAAAGGPTSVSLFGGTAGSETDLGLDVSVYNRTTTSWASNKYGVAGRVNGKVYVAPWQT